MEIKYIKKIKDNVYSVRIELKLTELEKDKICHFGDPEVDVGGNFTDGGSINFTLPNQFRELSTGFPYTQKFDGDSNPDAEDYAETWKDEMTVRLTAQINLVTSMNDDFTGEERLQV